MAGFGAFAPFGLLEFGSVESVAETIYRSMTVNLDGGVDLSVGGHTEASVYARAIALASVRQTIRHGFSQRRPKRAVEFLPALERQFGLSPSPGDSADARRAAVGARKLISRGSRREHLENSLRLLLGAAYVGLRVEAPMTAPGLYPSDPSLAGTWDAPATLPKFFRLKVAISSVGVATVGCDNLLGDGSRLAMGDRLCVEPEINGLTEAVTVLAASTSGPQTLRAVFSKPHEAGAIIRSHAPIWQSRRRTITVVVTHAAALDASTRRRIDALMRRLVRASTTWAIAYASSPGTLGPFTVGTSELGLVPIGVVTF